MILSRYFYYLLVFRDLTDISGYFYGFSGIFQDFLGYFRDISTIDAFFSGFSAGFGLIFGILRHISGFFGFFSRFHVIYRDISNDNRNSTGLNETFCGLSGILVF